MLFRVGIASSVVMFVSVFVLIAALYVTVEPVNRNFALLGLVLRLREATLGLVSAGNVAPVQVQALAQLAMQGASAAGTLSTVFMALGSLRSCTCSSPRICAGVIALSERTLAQSKEPLSRPHIPTNSSRRL